MDRSSPNPDAIRGREQQLIDQNGGATMQGGLDYAGSLVYKKAGNALTLESVGFDGGRFIASATSSGTTYTPTYFISDHLGSVRCVVDGNGAVLERNDYYPYGMRWNGGQLSDNRYRFNGKESQEFVSLPYNDHGARMSDPRMGGRWLTPDPLLEEFREHGQHVFCAGNPVKYMDMDGRKIVDAKGRTMWEAGQWTQYATKDAMRIGNAMMLSKTGTNKWNELSNRPENITVEMSAEVGRTPEGKLALGRVRGRQVDEKTSYHITVYEGSINEFVSDHKTFDDPEKQELMRKSTSEERVGAVATHEGLHVTDARWDGKREQRAVNEEKKYLDEVQSKNPIVSPTIKDNLLKDMNYEN